MSSEHVSWFLFFGVGERVIALPCWRKPRLYIVSRHWKQRWKDSEFYPAFKPRAKLFKLAVRALAVCKFLSAKKAVAGPSVCNLKSSVSFSRLAVLVGVDGPTQKLIARCLDSDGRPVAYIKYGEKPLACEKIKREAEILKRLSSIRTTMSHETATELSPQVLWSGAMDRGVALMISAVEGEMLEASLPSATAAIRCQMSEISEYLERLKVSDELFKVDAHPAIIRLREQVASDSHQLSISNEQLDSLLEPLRKQRWPMVIQHGDFTPWNVLRSPSSDLRPLTSGICAIDWEEGTAEGFPYFDLVYYVLQTAFLIHNWSPAKAFAYASSVISSQLSVDGGGSTTNNYQQSAEQSSVIGPRSSVVSSLIKLAALDACFRFESRTGAKAEALRQFRLAVINLKPNA